MSLVEAGRQVFPGMAGLAEPWATTRQTPLSHSLCRHVAASGSPLVLADARLDERACSSLAIGDLGVAAYAGMPLTGTDGHVLGSLCAIDHRPRAWTGQELADLADLAAACSGELRLRIMTQHAQRAQTRAERAGQEARSSAAQTAVALQRAQLMLQAAADLAGTTGLNEVRRSPRNLVSGDLKPAYVGLVLLDGRELRRVVDPDVSYVTEARSPAFPLTVPCRAPARSATGKWSSSAIAARPQPGTGSRGLSSTRPPAVRGVRPAARARAHPGRPGPGLGRAPPVLCTLSRAAGPCP